MTAPATTKWISDFEEGSRDLRDLLGGKGANVAEMTRLLGAELVPAGFTVTIDETGVGELVAAAVERGRRARPGLETGAAGTTT